MLSTKEKQGIYSASSMYCMLLCTVAYTPVSVVFIVYSVIVAGCIFFQLVICLFYFHSFFSF